MFVIFKVIFIYLKGLTIVKNMLFKNLYCNFIKIHYLKIN